MPYIPTEQRRVFDPLIDELAGQIARLAQESGSDGAFAGLFELRLHAAGLAVVRRRFGRLRYWLIAILTGTFKNIADEFYRRLAGRMKTGNWPRTAMWICMRSIWQKLRSWDEAGLIWRQDAKRQKLWGARRTPERTAAS